MKSAAVGLGLGILAGSVPFAWLIHRAITGGDLRREGSGNPGATNLVRSAGRLWGIAALALDAGKGAAAVGIARGLAGSGAGVPAAIGAIVGHAFSPWLGGRGGRGVAAAAGAFAVLAPWATLASVCAFAVVVAWTGWVSLGSVVAAGILPAAAFAAGADRRVIAAAVFAALLVAWRHRPNFARMRAGTEPRVGRRGVASGGRAR